MNVAAPCPYTPPVSVDEAAGLRSAVPPGGGPTPAEDERRAAADRRFLRNAAGVPVAALGLLFVPSAAVLFLLIAFAQVLAVMKARAPATPGNRGGVTGVPGLELTRLGRVVVPAAWLLVVAAVVADHAALRAWACAILALAGSSALLVRLNLGRARVTRDADRRARVEAPFRFAVTLAVPKGVAARALVVDDRVGPWTRPAAVSAAFPSVPGRARATAEFTLVPERRGWRRFRPVRLATTFPLGLFEAHVDLEAPCEVLVRPREGRATERLRRRLLGASHEQATSRRRLGDDELHGLRDWRLGDDPRRIHWRTSARRGTLTYVERLDEGHGDVVVALSRSAARGPVAEARFERSVAVAATVARAALREHRRVRLVLGEPDAPPPRRVRGRVGVEALLDALAEVRADGGRRPLAELKALLQQTDATVVWVTAASDAALPGVLAEAGAREAVVLAADDPELPTWVRGLR